VLDESPKNNVFDLDVNEVDFLGLENILSNSLDVNAFDFFFLRKIILCLKVKRSLIPFGRY
jgi:hypothetical protein